MTEIKRSEFIEFLKGYNNCEFVSMVTVTPVEMNQYKDYWKIDPLTGKKTKNPTPTPNPYYGKGIDTYSKKYKILTGFDYEKSVNGRREKEGKVGDFKSSENWMKHISKTLVTDKKTESKFYFRYQFQKDSVLEMEYWYEGNSIDKTLFESYMGKKSDYENQDLDNPLRFQVVNIDNIIEMSIGKEVYRLID